jgi:hypothetical protein
MDYRHIPCLGRPQVLVHMNAFLYTPTRPVFITALKLAAAMLAIYVILVNL